uniref:Uncharacterized protein n=1 Tax=Ciona intestinalis TaxID=7719 RepID=H2XMC1_CIOIN
MRFASNSVPRIIGYAASVLRFNTPPIFVLSRYCARGPTRSFFSVN